MVWILIGSCQVHDVSVHVDWHHVFFVPVIYCEARVSVLGWRSRSGDAIPVHWMSGVDCFRNLEGLRVCMTPSRESDDMLISFIEHLEPDAKFMQARLRRDVSNNDCKSPILLQLAEFFFQPRNFIPWILSIVKQPPVPVIAGLHVDTDDLSFRVEAEWL